MYSMMNHYSCNISKQLLQFCNYDRLELRSITNSNVKCKDHLEMTVD